MLKSPLPAIAVLIAVTPAYATDYTDTARVVSTTPIVERVREPRQECTPETPPQQPAPQAERSVVAPIIGGVAGALLGSTIGSGRGRAAATAAGAIAGTIVGDRVANPPGDRIDSRQAAAAQRCRTVEATREIIRGYSVVYQYNGRDITTTMAYDPGPTVRVAITALDGDNAGPAPTAAMTGGNAHEVAAPAEPRGIPTADLRTAQPSYSYRY